jgi:hypothetical protein
MATLTSTGVNCSNGTLDGYYTGTAYNNTSYPLGSYFVGDKDSCASFNLNATMNTCWTSPTYPYRWIWYNPGNGTAIAGTWRNRGSIQQVNLVQRVA